VDHAALRLRPATAVSSADASARELARAVWRLLVQIPIDYREHFAQIVSAAGLSMAQAHAVLQLDPDQPTPMGVLAQCLDNDPSNVTGLVDRLHRKGLVERRERPSDRRVKELILTEGGGRVRAEMLAALYEPPAALTRLAPDELRALQGVLEWLAVEAAGASMPGSARSTATGHGARVRAEPATSPSTDSPHTP